MAKKEHPFVKTSGKAKTSTSRKSKDSHDCERIGDITRHPLACIRAHSLSLVLLGLTLALKAGSYALDTGWWQDTLGGLGDDTWGALVIVVATKYFWEKGSAESK